MQTNEMQRICFELANVEVGSLSSNSAMRIGKPSPTATIHGNNSLAVGFLCSATGTSSSAFGTCNNASGPCSSTTGMANQSTGLASHTGGIECCAGGRGSCVIGELASDANLDNTFVWGDGTFITKPLTSHQVTIRATNGMRLIVQGNTEVKTCKTSWE